MNIPVDRFSFTGAIKFVAVTATRLCCLFSLLLLGLLASSCGKRSSNDAQQDLHLSTNGTVEVTAQLVEIPEGAIFKRDLYDYATVLKYQVLRVHRGNLDQRTIYVGHYNPWKPRNEAADARAKRTGGTLRQFQAGDIHHMALEAPIEDFFMGGIVDKYFGLPKTIYWAVWTNKE